MNEQLQTKLTDVIGYLEMGIKQTVDFTAEQTPLVIHELLTYSIITQCVKVLWSLIIIVIAYKCLRHFWKCLKDDFAQKEAAWCEWYQGMCCVFAFIAFTTLFITTYNITYKADKLFKLYFAPRIYLLEYVKEQIIPTVAPEKK